MTDGNYLSLAKILGKLAYWYDVAAADVPVQQQALAALADQIATDVIADNVNVLLFAQAASQLNSNITNGSTAQQAALINLAKNYLTGATVLSYFVSSIPATGAAASAVVTALIAEMTTNNKTFTTVSGTGLVNFLQQILPAAALPQASPGTHSDATYCVVAIV